MAEPRRGRRRGRATVREEERESAQYLTFALGNDTFGVEIARVREILEYEPPTEIPMVPEYIRGVINLRGMAVPVLDLARRMGRGEGRISRRACIVITEVGGGAAEGRGVAVGVMVDGVHEVLEIANDDIEPRPELGGDVRAEFIHGMARKASGFLVLLNVDFVFSRSEIALLGRIGEGGETAGRAPEPVSRSAPAPLPEATAERAPESEAVEAAPEAVEPPALSPFVAAPAASDAEVLIPVFGEATP